VASRPSGEPERPARGSTSCHRHKFAERRQDAAPHDHATKGMHAFRQLGELEARRRPNGVTVQQSVSHSGAAVAFARSSARPPAPTTRGRASDRVDRLGPAPCGTGAIRDRQLGRVTGDSSGHTCHGRSMHGGEDRQVGASELSEASRSLATVAETHGSRPKRYDLLAGFEIAAAACRLVLALESGSCRRPIYYWHRISMPPSASSEQSLVTRGPKVVPRVCVT
jgi:hypothetical protein